MDYTKPQGEVIAKYTVDYIVDRFDVPTKTVNLHGYSFKANNFNLTSSSRKVLLSNPICACCGRRGDTFILEKTRSIKTEEVSLHLYNTSSFSKKGRLKYIPFTVDHIIPKKLGGGNGHYNLQTMCTPCNRKKAANIQLRYIDTRLVLKLFKHNRKIIPLLVKTCIKQFTKSFKSRVKKLFYYKISIFIDLVN